MVGTSCLKVGRDSRLQYTEWKYCKEKTTTKQNNNKKGVPTDYSLTQTTALGLPSTVLDTEGDQHGCNL